MKQKYKVIIKNKLTGEIHQEFIEEGEYILHQFERKGIKLPFACRNGCCTTCAVKIISGSLDQKEAMGISKELKKKVMLFCVYQKQKRI